MRVLQSQMDWNLAQGWPREKTKTYEKEVKLLQLLLTAPTTDSRLSLLQRSQEQVSLNHLSPSLGSLCKTED